MKTFLILTLGALLACPALHADTLDNGTPPGPPPDGGPKPQHFKFLTDAEKAELKQTHDAALAANPALAQQEKALREKMHEARESGEPPDKDLMDQMHALHEQIDAAMIKIDPNVVAILAKIKAHHPHGGPGGLGGDGPPPPPPDSGN